MAEMEAASGELGELPRLDGSKALTINPLGDMGYFPWSELS
jgi:hypothetical protein